MLPCTSKKNLKCQRLQIINFKNSTEVKLAFLSSKAVGTYFTVDPLESNSETNLMSILQEAMTLW